jgi:acyl-coenzyme A synthetase/AMP-(fatty) acid ligase
VLAQAEDFTGEILAVLSEHGIAAVALSDTAPSALPGFERSSVTPEVVAPPTIEILSSGTTGTPKPFPIPYTMIARHLLRTNTISVQTIENFANLPPTLMFSPLANIAGLYSTIPPLLNGQRGVLIDRFTVEAWHDYVLRHRPTFTGMVSAGVKMVLDAQLPVEDLNCIKGVGVGSAPLDANVQRAFEKRYGIPILQSYGATEFGGPVTAMTLELHAQWGEKKFGSVGRPMAGVRVRVIDPDSGTELAPGRDGLLEVMTPRMGDHWIRTSDIAMLDEDGFLFHRGRADGAIVRGGFKLLPETIETALLLHPAVSAAAVIGLPHQRLGQVPAAAIQIQSGLVAPSIAELEAHLRERLPATHIPAHWHFVETLPHTPSLKVDRLALRQLFETSLAGVGE